MWLQADAAYGGAMLLSNPPMSAICIRYRSADLTEADSKKLHALVVERVEKSGRFWISTTELKGKTWFRINPANFRTRTEHMGNCWHCWNAGAARCFRAQVRQTTERFPVTKNCKEGLLLYDRNAAAFAEFCRTGLTSGCQSPPLPKPVMISTWKVSPAKHVSLRRR
jgi:hypothetical protein